MVFKNYILYLYIFRPFVEATVAAAGVVKTDALYVVDKVVPGFELPLNSIESEIYRSSPKYIDQLYQLFEVKISSDYAISNGLHRH